MGRDFEQSGACPKGAIQGRILWFPFAAYKRLLLVVPLKPLRCGEAFIRHLNARVRKIVIFSSDSVDILKRESHTAVNLTERGDAEPFRKSQSRTRRTGGLMTARSAVRGRNPEALPGPWCANTASTTSSFEHQGSPDLRAHIEVVAPPRPRCSSRARRALAKKWPLATSTPLVRVQLDRSCPSIARCFPPS